jgi:peptidoglycan/xylan/chitin deacetylase (PgdA/CDA1 family)
MTEACNRRIWQQGCETMCCVAKTVSDTGFFLNFHGLGKPKRKVTPEDEQYWLEERVFAEILDSVQEREDVHITFDDSNESDFTIALPLLKSRRMTARFFVLGGCVGQPGFMSSEQVEVLCTEGMTVGSHGMHHRKWPDLSEKELEVELVEARERLEHIAGMSVTEAACPFGEYDRRVLRRLRELGYQKVYTSDGGPSLVKAWMQPRNTLCCGDDMARISNILTAAPYSAEAIWRRCKLALKRWR